jgi:protein HOOK3
MAHSNKPMPSFSYSAQAALLKSANKLFQLRRSVDSLDELASGVTLGHILHELDPEFDPSALETSQGTSKYLSNKRSIQAVYKGLFRFIRRQIPSLGYQAKKVDYHAIAENPDAQGISQLLAVMVAVATLGPNNQQYIPRIRNLDLDAQNEIMQILRVIQEEMAASHDDDDLDEAMESVMEARDMDLLVEEQNAALREQLETTKKTLSDYLTRLEHLQMSHEELRFEKEKNDREIEILRKATQDGANSAETVKILETRVHEQMDIIARNEETIRNHERIKTQLELEVERLTQRANLVDELRDQVAEFKHKAEEFEKKANTADRFKQKLESQQHLVKELQNLQYEKGDLQERYKALLEDNERHARTRKAEDELTKMITQSERDLWDERSHKNQLLQDLTRLEEENIRLQGQRAHDESVIQSLQEQLQEGGIAGSSEDQLGGDGGISNLEDELLNATNDDAPPPKPNPNQSLELSRLKAENELLRTTMGSKSRRELEEEKDKNERLIKNYNDIFERHALAQNQIEILMGNLSDEGLVKTVDQIMREGPFSVLTSVYYRTTAFQNIRQRNIQLESDLEAAKKRVAELENQNADQARELLTVKTDLSAVGKDAVDALNDLKNTDNLVAKSLQSELERLRAKHTAVIEERDIHKSQLVEALLAKESLAKAAAQDGKVIPDSLAQDPDIVEGRKNQSEKIEKLRERLKERNEVSGSNLDLDNVPESARDDFPASANESPRRQAIEEHAAVSAINEDNPLRPIMPGFGYTPPPSSSSSSRPSSKKRKNHVASQGENKSRASPAAKWLSSSSLLSNANKPETAQQADNSTVATREIRGGKDGTTPETQGRRDSIRPEGTSSLSP